MVRHGGELVGGITAYADTVEEMREKYVLTSSEHLLLSGPS